jgi:hypothetical protein
MLDPIVESIEYRLLVFDFFPYGIWNVAHGRVRAAARTQHTGVPMPEMRSVPVHRRIGFLNDLFYGRSHIAGPGESSIALLLDEKPAVVPVGSRRERSGGTRRFLRAPMAMNSSERRRRLALASSFRLSDYLDRSTRRAGARAGRPRCLRILMITGGSSMAAMIFKAPPQFGQCSMSISKTRFSSLAQVPSNSDGRRRGIRS